MNLRLPALLLLLTSSGGCCVRTWLRERLRDEPVQSTSLGRVVAEARGACVPLDALPEGVPGRGLLLSPTGKSLLVAAQADDADLAAHPSYLQVVDVETGQATPFDVGFDVQTRSLRAVQGPTGPWLAGLRGHLIVRAPSGNEFEVPEVAEPFRFLGFLPDGRALVQTFGAQDALYRLESPDGSEARVTRLSLPPNADDLRLRPGTEQLVWPEGTQVKQAPASDLSKVAPVATLADDTTHAIGVGPGYLWVTDGARLGRLGREGQPRWLLTFDWSPLDAHSQDVVRTLALVGASQDGTVVAVGLSAGTWQGQQSRVGAFRCPSD